MDRAIDRNRSDIRIGSARSTMDMHVFSGGGAGCDGALPMKLLVSTRAWFLLVWAADEAELLGLPGE